MKERKAIRKGLVFGTILVLVCMVFAGVPMNVGAEETCPDGMVSYWRLDEGSGNIAGDSADANDGILVPTRPTWIAGKIGGALSFDGVDDYFMTNQNVYLNELANGVTFASWVFLPDISTKSYSIFGHGGGGWNPYQFWELRVYPDLSFRLMTAHGSTYHYPFSDPNTAPLNQWFHVAGTLWYEGGKTHMRLYVNGIEEITEDISGMYMASIQDRPIFIGASSWSGGSYRHGFLEGMVDEASIYNRVLTLEEIQQHYNNGLAGIEITPDANTVGLWHFDDGSGTTAIDSSGNNNDGTLYPSVTGPTWTSGQVGGALDFDGVEDYVTVLNNGLEPEQLTFEAWFKKDRPYSPWLQDRLMESVTNGGWGIGIDGDKIFLTRTGYSVIRSDGTIGDTNWHHIAVTHDGTTTCFYIDGFLDVCKAYIASFSSTGDYTIGSRGASAEFFDGIIDEIAIWDRVLSPTEIQNHYINGLLGYDYCYSTPDQAIQYLFDDIQDLEDLPEGTETSLLSKLDAALECLENDNDNAAINILNAFINAIEAQSGKKFTVEQANELIAEAEAIIDEI